MIKPTFSSLHLHTDGLVGICQEGEIGMSARAENTTGAPLHRSSNPSDGSLERERRHIERVEES